MNNEDINVTPSPYGFLAQVSFEISTVGAEGLIADLKAVNAVLYPDGAAVTLSSLLIAGISQYRREIEKLFQPATDACHCENAYFNIEECPRCTPVRKDGRCNRCGTMGDHYCHADVARS